MCLLFVAVDAHPAYRLVLAGNRDEAHARPTEPLGWWPDAPHVAAGRDFDAGGTWLGATRTGPSGIRWATVTNVRDPGDVHAGRRSRGALVADFLRGYDAPAEYAARVQAERDLYNGFNLLVGVDAEVHYASSRREHAEKLAMGVYGLSNDTLDTPWPKLTRGRDAFARVLAGPRLDPTDLLGPLRDETRPPDGELPHTGVGLDLERVLSPVFIRGEHYGTRASTALLVGCDGGGRVAERTWGPDGARGPFVEIDLAQASAQVGP